MLACKHGAHLKSEDTLLDSFKYE